MVLLLDNAEIAQLLTMDDCMSALEEAYREQAEGRAINQRRYDTVMPLPHRPEREARYRMQTLVCVLPRFGIAALRMTSLLQHRPIRHGHEVDANIKEGVRPVGLIQLYSVETGEPLAFLHEEVISGLRVGGTFGLACKYLAREDAAVVGLWGSGWQARFQLLAASLVRRVRLVKVYSPTPEHRAAFARQMAAELGVEVRAVDSPEEAEQGVDILITSTNARGALIQPEHMAPGRHIMPVRNSEISNAALAKADRIVTLSTQRYLTYVGGEGQYGRLVPPPERPFEHGDLPLLEDIIVGRIPGRTRTDEVTVFTSGSGMGIQFAALGAKAYARARERGLGREIPSDWLIQET